METAKDLIPEFEILKLTDAQALQLENFTLKEQLLKFEKNNIIRDIAESLNVHPSKIINMNASDKSVTIQNNVKR
jgi:hypothetical protein